MALSRNQKKFITIERAKRRLQHRLDDIDWEMDELTPATEKIGELEAAGKKVSIGQKQIESGK